jgi:hypothetical protein
MVLYVLSLQILREIWKISNLVSKRTDREFETLIIDIIDTPLKGLFSDKNYKYINLLYYYYI